MKKLLSLLSVLTISGTAVPTTIAASPYQKEETKETKLEKSKINYSETNNLENLSRNEREINNENEVDCGNWFCNEVSGYFTPEFWTEVTFLFYHNNKSDFIEKFINKLSGISVTLPVFPSGDYNRSIKRFSAVIYDSFLYINNIFNNSSKKECIKIVAWRQLFQEDWVIWKGDVNIITSDRYYYPNKYLNNIKEDFNAFEKNALYLGIINNDDDDITILNAIKNNNKNLEINDLEIFDKKSYSNFTHNFSAKIKVSNKSKNYSHIILKSEIFYLTKMFLEKDLPKLIDNEELVKNWNDNFNSWENEINRQIKEDLPKYGNDEKGKALLKTWVGDKINNINDRLLSLNLILTTIDNKFKINELYQNIKYLEADINNLKNNIINLSNKINKIKKELNEIKNLKTFLFAFIESVNNVSVFIPTINNIKVGLSNLSNIFSKISNVLN